MNRNRGRQVDRADICHRRQSAQLAAIAIPGIKQLSTCSVAGFYYRATAALSDMRVKLLKPVLPGQSKSGVVGARAAGIGRTSSRRAATIRTSPVSFRPIAIYGDPPSLSRPTGMGPGRVREDERFLYNVNQGQPEEYDDEQCCWQGRAADGRSTRLGLSRKVGVASASMRQRFLVRGIGGRRHHCVILLAVGASGFNELIGICVRSAAEAIQADCSWRDGGGAAQRPDSLQLTSSTGNDR